MKKKLRELEFGELNKLYDMGNIEKGIPIPPKGGIKRRLLDMTPELMEVGDSQFVRLSDTRYELLGSLQTAIMGYCRNWRENNDSMDVLFISRQGSVIIEEITIPGVRYWRVE